MTMSHEMLSKLQIMVDKMNELTSQPEKGGYFGCHMLGPDFMPDLVAWVGKATVEATRHTCLWSVIVGIISFSKKKGVPGVLCDDSTVRLENGIILSFAGYGPVRDQAIVMALAIQMNWLERAQGYELASPAAKGFIIELLAA